MHQYILFLLILTLFSCGGTEISESNNNSTSTEKKELPRLFMRTKINHARVRKTPDLEGAMIYTLKNELLVEYMHDSTTFNTEITYNYKNYNTNWYKIKTFENVEGWVYAAFIEFLTPEENKKVLLQRETTELLEAANEKQPQISQKQKKELSQPLNSGLVSSYQNYLNSLNKNDPNSVGLAIARFQATFIGNNVRTCDAGYVAFHGFYMQTLGVLGRGNFGAYQSLAAEIQRYKGSPMNMDDYTKTLAINGFNLAVKDGKVVLAEDVDFLYRIFYRECSTPMRAYMNQYQLEEPNFWLDSEKLMIHPETLARWVLSWNYIVATYPEFSLYADAKQRLEKQLNILLKGSSKTPVFNQKTQTIQADFLAAYRHITEKYPDSKIGKTFKNYLQVLEENNWKNSSDVGAEMGKVLGSFAL